MISQSSEKALYTYYTVTVKGHKRFENIILTCSMSQTAILEQFYTSYGTYFIIQSSKCIVYMYTSTTYNTNS